MCGDQFRRRRQRSRICSCRWPARPSEPAELRRSVDTSHRRDRGPSDHTNRRAPWQPDPSTSTGSVERPCRTTPARASASRTQRASASRTQRASASRPSGAPSPERDEFIAGAAASDKAARTSSTDKQGWQPSLMRALVPAEAELRIDPGTASTGTPRSPAIPAVMSEPPRSWLSTTTSRSHRATRIRFLAGNLHGAGAVPSGYSETIAPEVATATHRSALLLGYTTS